MLAREVRSWLSLDGEKRGERREKREERREKRGERRDGARNEEWRGATIEESERAFFFPPLARLFFSPSLEKSPISLSLSLSLSFREYPSGVRVFSSLQRRPSTLFPCLCSYLVSSCVFCFCYPPLKSPFPDDNEEERGQEAREEETRRNRRKGLSLLSLAFPAPSPPPHPPCRVRFAAAAPNGARFLSLRLSEKGDDGGGRNEEGGNGNGKSENFVATGAPARPLAPPLSLLSEVLVSSSLWWWCRM